MSCCKRGSTSNRAPQLKAIHFPPLRGSGESGGPTRGSQPDAWKFRALRSAQRSVKLRRHEEPRQPALPAINGRSVEAGFRPAERFSHSNGSWLKYHCNGPSLRRLCFFVKHAKRQFGTRLALRSFAVSFVPGERHEKHRPLASRRSPCRHRSPQHHRHAGALITKPALWRWSLGRQRGNLRAWPTKSQQPGGWSR